MKKNFKRALSLGLAVGLVATSAGCGQSSSEQGQSSASTSTTTSAAASENPLEGVELTSTGYAAEYYNEDGTHKLPFNDTDYVYKVVWKKDNYDRGTMEDKYILQEAFKATGIKFEIEEVAESAWDDKISIMFASGELPDLILGEVDNLVNYADQCADLTDLLPVYAPYVYDFYYNQYPGLMAVNQFGGRVKSLNVNRINGAHSDYLWTINKRWLDNVGMDIPTTTDELYEVLKAFKEQDANGNGDPTDEIPYLYVQLDGASGLLNMMSSFGMVNDGPSDTSQYLMVEDGQVKFAPTDDRFYDMLVYLNKLYSEGLLDPDGLVQEQTDRNLKGQADRIGYLTHGGLVTTAVGEELGNDYQYILPPASEHGSVIKQRIQAAEISAPCFIITKDCPNPEKLLVMANWTNSTHENRFVSRFGPEGTSWYRTENGKAANQNDYSGKAYTNNTEATRTCTLQKRWCICFTAEEEAFREYVDFSIPYNDVEQNLYGPSGGHAWDEGFPLGNDTLENAQARSEMFAEIDTYIQNFIAVSMTGGIDEAKWQEHLKKCEALNIAEFLERNQTLYDNIMSNQ